MRVGTESRPVLEHRTKRPFNPMMSAPKSTHGGGKDAGGSDGPWLGPIPERDMMGELTGEQYLRCKFCGAEVLDGEEHNATHKPGCEARGVSDV